MPTPMTGAQLRAWMKRHKFTADVLAATLDVSQNAIYRWLNGSRSIDRRTELALTAIAKTKAAPASERYFDVRVRIDPTDGSVTLLDGDKARRPRRITA